MEVVPKVNVDYRFDYCCDAGDSKGKDDIVPTLSK